MTQADPLATGKSIILEVVGCLRANVEPLLYSTVAPTRYFVYLHPSDFERLQGLIPRLEAEARRALDEEVRRWNAEARPPRSPLDWFRRKSGAPPIEAPAAGWEIRFEADVDGEMSPGDIAVASELALPQAAELSGSKTRRITTLRSGEHTTTREQVLEGTAEAGGTVFGRLTYDDRKGRHEFAITRSLVIVGRGGIGYWVDVKLDISPDVSREHLRIRRDEADGQFFLKDMSTLGTTLDGAPVPPSLELVDGVRRDRGVEVKLPPRARIGLANAVVVEFTAGGGA